MRGTATLTEASGNPVARNQIQGGDGYTQSDAGDATSAVLGSAGVLIQGSADVDLTDDAIQPGQTSGTSFRLRGIESRTSGLLRVLRSRIYGGPLPSGPVNPSCDRVGIWAGGSSQGAFLENDMIYAGAGGTNLPAYHWSFGVWLANTSNPVVRHCTAYSGPSDYNGGASKAILLDGVTGASIENNLIAADASWNIPMYSNTCASLGAFKAFENNLMFNTSDDLNLSFFSYGGAPGGACTQFQKFDTIDALEAHLTTYGVTATGNLTLKPACGTDSGCITWPSCGGPSPSSLACLSSVFTEWSSTDNGLSTLFGTGWKLKSTVPCAIAKSSLDVGTSTDLYGTSRTSPPSMGAFELDSACAP